MWQQTPHAEILIRLLENDLAQSRSHLIIETRPQDLHFLPNQYHSFNSKEEALDYLDVKLGNGDSNSLATDDPLFYTDAKKLIKKLELNNPLTIKTRV